MEFIKEIYPLLLLIASFFGHGIFIYKKFKLPVGLIPILIFSLIIIIEYFAAIINILTLISDIIILSGLFLFIFYLVHFLLSKKNQIISDFTKRIDFEKQLLITQVKEGGGRKAFLLLLILLIGICLSLSISTRLQNYWNHPLIIKVSILFGLFLFISFIILVIFPFISKSVLKNGKIPFISIFISIFFVLAFFPTKWPMLTILPNKINVIEIMNTGKKNIESDDYAIKLIEIKDLILQEKIHDDKYDDQIIHEKDSEYLLIDKKNETDIFRYESNRINNFDLLFITDKSSGIVKININGNESEVDLYSDTAGIYSFKAPLQFNALSYALLISDVISFMVFIFIISWIFINGFSGDQESKNINPISKPGFILFLFSLVALYFVTKNFVFYAWDEFTHWATIVKELSILNQLPGKLFCTFTPTYIPGYSLFQYLIIRVLGFTEGHVYYSHAIFILAGIYLIVSDFSLHKFMNMLINILCIFLVMCLLPLMFFTLYVDATLGILLGVSFISYLLLAENKINISFLLIFLGAIQLIKTWGLVFAIMIFGFVIIHQILIMNRLKGEPRDKKELILFALLFLLLTIIIQASWQIHLILNNIYSNNPGFYNIKDYYGSFNQSGSISLENKLAYILAFLRIILINGRNNQGLISPFSIINIAGFLVLLGIILSLQNKKNRNDLFVINSLLVLFSIINIILLLFVYGFISSPEKGITLPSFERYVSEYLLGWFIVILFLICRTSTENKGKKSLLITPILPIFILILIILGLNQKSYFNIPPQKYKSNRLEVHTDILKNIAFISDGQTRSKTYVIYQNNASVRPMMMRYELCPNLVQNYGWTISTELDNTYDNTVIKSPDEINNQIHAGFDFVLIWKADAKFWKDYGKIFPGHSQSENQLYKVTNEGLLKVS